MFSQIFMQTIFPLLLDAGKVVFYCSCVYGVYNLMRRQVGEGVDRLKWAGIGYIAMRLIELFLNIVDRIAAAMINKM